MTPLQQGSGAFLILLNIFLLSIFIFMYFRMLILAKMGAEVVQHVGQKHRHDRLPSLIDKIATRTPNRPVVSLSQSQCLEDGSQYIRFGDLLRAASKRSYRMLQKLRESESFKNLSYISPQDVCHIILLLAAAKTGYRVRLPHDGLDQG